MKKIIILVMFVCLPVFAKEVVSPNVLLGAEDYEHKMCVDREANRCIETICLTSEQRDCPEQCRKGAEDKCKLERVP